MEADRNTISWLRRMLLALLWARGDSTFFLSAQATHATCARCFAGSRSVVSGSNLISLDSTQGDFSLNRTFPDWHRRNRPGASQQPCWRLSPSENCLTSSKRRSTRGFDPNQEALLLQKLQSFSLVFLLVPLHTPGVN